MPLRLRRLLGFLLLALLPVAQDRLAAAPPPASGPASTGVVYCFCRAKFDESRSPGALRAHVCQAHAGTAPAGYCGKQGAAWTPAVDEMFRRDIEVERVRYALSELQRQSEQHAQQARKAKAKGEQGLAAVAKDWDEGARVGDLKADDPYRPAPRPSKVPALKKAKSEAACPGCCDFSANLARWSRLPLSADVPR